MNEIIFLGTGGGRVVMTTQMRATGGFRINTENFKIHIDPGTGSIVRCKQFHQNPQNLDAVIATHGHPDHSADINVYSEAMFINKSKKKRTILASESVINGIELINPVLSKYHSGLTDEVKVFKKGSIHKLEKGDDEVIIKGLEARHKDPTTFGVRLEFKKLNKIISYTSDTSHFENLEKIHKGADILIANVTRPGKQRLEGHLCSEDAAKLLKEAKPSIALLNHMGMKVLRNGPRKEAAYIQRESQVRTIPAEDGLRVSLHEDKQATLKKFNN